MSCGVFLHNCESLKLSDMKRAEFTSSSRIQLLHGNSCCGGFPVPAEFESEARLESKMVQNAGGEVGGDGDGSPATTTTIARVTSPTR